MYMAYFYFYLLNYSLNIYIINNIISYFVCNSERLRIYIIIISELATNSNSNSNSNSINSYSIAYDSVRMSFDCENSKFINPQRDHHKKLHFVDYQLSIDSILSSKFSWAHKLVSKKNETIYSYIYIYIYIYM